MRDEGLYQHFKNHLQEIIDRAQYYPVIYQARILTQTLRLIEDPEPDLEGNLRRVAQGLLGVANLVAVGRGLATGDLRLDEFQEGIKLLKEAFEEQRIQPEAWYSELLILEEAMLRCLKEHDLRFYPEPAELVQRAKDIPCRKRERVAAVFGSDKINQYKQALRFGIAMQLRTLALQGPTPAVRQGSIERLIALVQPEAWGADADIMVGLLNSLALVAAQSQSASDAAGGSAVVAESQADLARVALEALADKLEPALAQQSRKGRWGSSQRPSTPEAAASKTFREWLGGEGRRYLPNSSTFETSLLPSKTQPGRETCLDTSRRSCL